LELQRRLAETGRLMPIVFLSARASEEEERRALEAGAVSFFTQAGQQRGLAERYSCGA